jgi:hypothetical protein
VAFLKLLGCKASIAVEPRANSIIVIVVVPHAPDGAVLHVDRQLQSDPVPDGERLESGSRHDLDVAEAGAASRSRSWVSVMSGGRRSRPMLGGRVPA